MADNTDLHERFQKEYIESDPMRRKELLQKEMNVEWTTVYKIGKLVIVPWATKTTTWAE